MTDPDTELAREILNTYKTTILHYHDKEGRTNEAQVVFEAQFKYVEEKFAKAIRSVRQEENEACAKVASEYHYGKLGSVGVQEASEEIATAIRKLGEPND